MLFISVKDGINITVSHFLAISKNLQDSPGLTVAFFYARMSTSLLTPSVLQPRPGCEHFSWPGLGLVATKMSKKHIKKRRLVLARRMMMNNKRQPCQVTLLPN